MTRAVGLDLSLSSSGVACADGTLHVVGPGKATGPRRLSVIVDQLDRLIARGRPELAVLEGAAGVQYASTALVLGELRGAVKLRLFQRDVPVVEVPPASLKKWATGNGKASKAEMVAAAQTAGARIGALEDDKADAFWLRRLGEVFGRVVAEAGLGMSDAALLAWLKGGA